MVIWRNSNPEKLEMALLPHLDDLFRTAKGVFSSEFEAAFIVRKTYLQALKSASLPKSEESCRAWLFQILFQLIHRHRVKVLRFENALEGSRGIPPTPLTPLPEQLDDQDFMTALARIPKANRVILQLIDVEAFSYRETSELLGIPVETVRSLLVSSRAILRGELSRQSTDPSRQPDWNSRPGRIF